MANTKKRLFAKITAFTLIFGVFAVFAFSGCGKTPDAPTTPTSEPPAHSQTDEPSETGQGTQESGRTRPRPTSPPEPEYSTSPPQTHPLTREFRDITATKLVSEIGIGWNLGNTLDAYHSANPSVPMPWVNYDDMVDVEVAWIGGTRNLATTPALIGRVKEAGFNAIRVPVTWYEMASEYPNFVIREDWLDHVQKIVDMAVELGMYVIINTHHDEFIMRFDEPAKGERAVYQLWLQIAERFRDYNEKLIFEGLNEPRARTNEWNRNGQWDWNGYDAYFKTLNRWNQAFVDAVRSTGGNNTKRHLMLATYAAQSRPQQLHSLVLPTDPIEANGTSRFILSVHTYSPFWWAHDGRGSYEGDEAIRNDLERVADYAHQLGVPVILGEWGSVRRNDHDQRVTHANDYVRIATEMRNREKPVAMACFWWDDQDEFRLIDRTRAQTDDNALEIIGAMLAGRGVG